MLFLDSTIWFQYKGLVICKLKSEGDETPYTHEVTDTKSLKRCFITLTDKESSELERVEKNGDRTFSYALSDALNKIEDAYIKITNN